MLLIEKVQELQAIQPPLDPTEMKRRIQEWKKSTGYKAPGAIEVKEVKTQDSPEIKDPNEESQNNTGSEALDSGSGQSQLNLRSLVNLDLMNLRAERAISMDAEVDARKSRRSLEEASGFIADFKSSANVINEVGVFKDKDGNVIDTSDVEIEEEKIPAFFTQERKDYYDEKGFAYDNTIVADKPEIEITEEQRLDEAEQEYIKANGTDIVRLSPVGVKKYQIFGPDYNYDQNRTHREIKFKDFAKLKTVKNQALSVLDQINDPSFAEFTPKEITDQAALNHFGKLDDIRIQDTTTFSVGTDKEYYTNPRYKNKKEYEDYLLKTLGEEKFEQYKLYNPTYSNIYSDDFEGGDFGVTPEQQEQATNELIAKKVQRIMYSADDDANMSGSTLGSNRALGIISKIYDENIGEAQKEVKALDVFQNDLEKRSIELQQRSDEIQVKLDPIVKNIQNLSNKSKELKAKIQEYKDSNFFSSLNPGYIKAVEEYNESITNYQQAYNEYKSSEIGKLANTLNQDVKVYKYRLDQFEKRAEASSEDPAKVIEHALGLDYSNWAKVTNSLYNTFIKDTKNFANLTAQGFLKMVNFLGGEDAEGEAIINTAVYNLEQNMYDYNKERADYTQANIAPSVSLDDIGKDGIGFFDFSMQALSDQTGTIALGASYLLTGGATALTTGGLKAGSSFATRRAFNLAQKRVALAQQRIVSNTFFAVETGGAISEANREKYDAVKSLDFYNEAISSGQYTAEELEDMGLDIDDIRRKANYSWNSMAFNAYGAGAVAKYAEKLGTLRMPSILRNSSKRRGMENIIKTKIYKHDFGLKALYTGKRALQGLRPLATKAIPGELLEESLTEIGHKALRYYALDENGSWLEGINKDFLAKTSLSSLAMMSPGSMQNVFTTLKSDFRSIDDLSANIKLRDRLNQITLLMPSLEGTRLVEAKKEKRDILRTFALNEVSTIQKLNHLTADQIFEIAEASRIQRDLAKQARLIGQDGGTDAESRNEIAKINEQYSNLQKVKDNLLNTKKRQMALEAKNMREQMGAPSAIDLEYNLGLYDMAVDSAGVLMNKDGNFIQIPAKEDGGFPSPAEVINILKENGYDDARAEALASQLVGDAPVNALHDGNNIIVNDYAIKARIYTSLNKGDAEYAAIAPIEEIFHANIKAKNLRNADGELSDLATQAIEDTIRILKQNRDNGVISEQDYNDLLERFELYRDGKGKVVLKSGERGAADVDIEEVMAQMNNANILGKINANDLKGTPSIRTFLNGVISNIMGDSAWLMDLKDSNDVLNFLDTFKKRYEARNILVDSDEETDTTTVIDLQNQDEVDMGLETEVDLGPIRTAASRGRQINPAEEAAGYQVAPLAAFLAADVKSGEKTNEQLIVDAAPKNNATPEVRIASQDALVEANWPVIRKALKIDPSGKIPQPFIKLAVQEMFRDTFPGRGVEAKFFDKFDPSLENKVTTFLEGQLNMRTGDILERAKALESGKQDLGIEKAGGVIDTTVTETVKETAVKRPPSETGVYTPVVAENLDIDVLTEKVDQNGDRIPKTSAQIKTEVDAVINEAIKADTKGVTGVTRFGQVKVGPQLAAVLGKAFNLNPKVFLQKGFNLSGNFENLRQYLLKNAQEDFSNLPEAYDPSISGKNRVSGAAFIPENVKKEFYKKVEGTNRFELDKSKTVKDYINLLKESDGRSTGAQTVKGLADLHFRNKIAETLIEPSTRRITGIKFNRGKKLVNPVDVLRELESGANVQSYNKTLRIFGAKPLSSKNLDVNSSKLPSIVTDYLNKNNIPIPEGLEDFLDKNFKGVENFKDFDKKFSQLKKDFSELYQDGDKNKPIKGGLNNKKIKDSITKSFFDTITANKDVLEYRNWVRNTLFPLFPKSFFTSGAFAGAGVSGPSRNFYYYAVGDLDLDNNKFAPEDADIAAAVTRVGYTTGVGINRKITQSWYKNEFLTGNTAKLNKQKLKGLEKIFLKFQKLMNTGTDAQKIANMRGIAALLSSTSQGMGGIVRVAAPITFVGTKLNNGIVEEHTMPASLVAKYLFESAIKGDVKTNFKNVAKNYQQGLLGKLDDNKLKGNNNGIKFNYTQMMPQDWQFADNVWDRYFNFNVASQNGGINGNNYVMADGKTLAQVAQVTPSGLPITNKNKAQIKAANVLNASMSNLANNQTNEGQINTYKNADKAISLGQAGIKASKGISIFDFDDTLARSKSKVIVTMPFLKGDSDMADIVARRLFKDKFKNLPSYKQTYSSLNAEDKLKVLKEIPGKTKKINATEFAKESANLEAQGATFDFSEFAQVIKGEKGPLFDLAVRRKGKFGNKDIFILTARPDIAAPAIYEFLKGVGLEIPLENITGLADGKPEAKANWVIEKAAQGYNDFYFADDAIKNVKAVKQVLDQIDVKSKVQLAKANKGKAFNTIVNDMIFDSSGIESYKTFSAAKARTIGRDKGRFDWLTMASSAEDFKGLLYRLLGNGKKGEAQYEFLKTNLMDPYNKAEDSITQAKIAAANDFMALKEQFPGIPKTLETETGVGKFTYQHALRVYMWTQQGMSIPGLSKTDVKKLNKFITDDAKLQAFADQLISIQKGKPYPKPGKDWLAGNLTTDIIGGINKVNRKEYLQEWQENVDIIFSPENLNKMEAAYGTRWRKALENTLTRMKAGTNRLGYNDQTSAVLDWVNNSVGAVMFLNTRSALLQTISAVNFINWGDNNIIAAGKAFANQKQFWGDFMTLMNSDYLVQRRNGLKINVSESEIADAVKDSKNKVKAAIAFLLSKGFVLTRYADSFAIASGGATFYRNRIKKYLKEGMDQKLAEEKAFQDFRRIAEESQQSSSPDKISMQQASAAGRVILNWANTPMQYVRIQKRDIQDLIAGRGDPKVKMSRIAYYGVVQNLIFNAMQQALFAIGFGDDDDEEKSAAKKKQDEKKIARVANGMIDSQLKGLGIAGAGMVAVKNTLMKIYEESGKKRPEYEKAAIEALSFSPAISSKYRKIVGGLKSFSWNMKEMKEKGFSLDNPAYLAGAQIITATTNIPIDRVIKKANNIRGILSEQSQMWQKVILFGGWSTWDVGLPYYGGWDKPIEPTPAELKKQNIDLMKRDTNTAEQTQMLLDLGLDKKQIKALRYEDARVKKIIELQNKKKDGITTIRKDK